MIYRCLPLVAALLAALAHAEEAPVASVEGVTAKALPSVVVVTVAGRDGQQQHLGAGFVISRDGLIATNNHVIGEARPIAVTFADGRRHEVVSVHATERAHDLAILKIEADDLPALELGDSDQVKQGQPVVALGNPLGLRHSVVSGVVSGEREIDGRKMIQLAIPVEPGNSGGPVLDLGGRVLGIVTMKSAVTENLGFAAQVNALKPLLESPNPIPMSRWLTIGKLPERLWEAKFGASWRRRGGSILVQGAGEGFGGRSLCLWKETPPEAPYEIAVQVKLDDEAGAAGLVFDADGGERHYGFYPSGGKLRLSRFDGANVFTWQVLANVDSPHYRPGEWNRLKVRVEEDKLLCYVNDELVVTSPDRSLKPGRAGLAKFRQTQAEFKGFRVAKEIASPRLSQEKAAVVSALLDKLPPLAELKTEDLAPLLELDDLGPAALREQADRLEAQAQELRRVAADVHVQAVAAELKRELDRDDKDRSLARAALLIGRLDDAEAEVDGYLKEIDAMAEEIRQALPDGADEGARRAALHRYLFEENGFHGSRTDYYHQANSHLQRVIDDREGIPITLSVLYMELGRRLDLAIEGVGLPGHFVVRHLPAEGEPQLIDVFEGGKKMSREDAAKQVAAAGQVLRDEHLAAASDQAIIERMLGNLLNVADRQRDKEAMLRCLEALVAVDPQAVRERGLRAVLRFETGRRSAAIDDLDWFLRERPEGLDLDRIRQMRELFERSSGPPVGR